MVQKKLFPDLAESEVEAEPPASRLGEVRVVRPVRNQIQMVMQDLDATLPQDHSARAIWDMLERLDLSGFYASIQSVVGGPGRPASDPAVLLGLWVYATAEGVGSARKLARLCGEHDGFRWLCGGVPVDYHLLSDFRSEHQQAMDELLTKIVGVLMSEELVSLKEVAQDGVRVRASAGSGSFRRKERLEQHLEAARDQVRRLAQEREHPDTGESKRERAAQERAGRERVERVVPKVIEVFRLKAVVPVHQRGTRLVLRVPVTMRLHGGDPGRPPESLGGQPFRLAPPAIRTQARAARHARGASVEIVDVPGRVLGERVGRRDTQPVSVRGWRVRRQVSREVGPGVRPRDAPRATVGPVQTP